MTRDLRPLLLALCSTLAASACPASRSPDGSVAEEGPMEAGGDGPAAAADAAAEGDGARRGGPLTMVSRSLVLSTEYVCDSDGDGAADNSVADLLAPASELFAMALTSVVQTNIDEGLLRLIVHFPWIDDLDGLTDESATAIIFDGRDLDDESEPYHHEDDFSGTEPLAVFWRYLDACGEPISSVPEVRVEAGEVHGENGLVPIVLADANSGAEVILAREAMLLGSIEPGAGAASFTICGYAAIEDLGRVPGPPETGDLTLLEVLVAGGELFAIPGVPGLDADIDVDGDGLETFFLDETSRLASCVDGDRTVIEGRDCWQDERMADGYSITFVLSTVPAVFGERQPDWEDEVHGTCDDPPETSLFDPA